MSNTKNITVAFLKKKNACTVAVKWGTEQKLIGKPAKVVMDALIKADKLDWANWLVVRVLPYKGYVSYAVFAAEQVIDIYEKKYPKDKRPRDAIESAKKCIKNPSAENKKIASAASAARFFYSAKVSKRERDAGLEGVEVASQKFANGTIRRCPKHDETFHSGKNHYDCGCPFVYGDIEKTITSRNNHPTLKPISLTTYLAKLILPPKLDKQRRLLVPFAGSGSEVIGGLLAGWDEVIGVEREKEYCEIAEARINHWMKCKDSSPQSSSSLTSVPQESTDGQETLGV